jgi:hypothetical protein
MVMAEATIIPNPEIKLRIRGRVIPFSVNDLSIGPFGLPQRGEVHFASVLFARVDPGPTQRVIFRGPKALGQGMGIQETQKTVSWVKDSEWFDLAPGGG